MITGQRLRPDAAQQNQSATNGDQQHFTNRVEYKSLLPVDRALGQKHQEQHPKET
jgi:hypothetical protein